MPDYEDSLRSDAPDRPRRREIDDRDDDRPYRGSRYDVRRGSDRQDRDHLRILSICHYVFGGLAALGSSFGLLYVIIGVLMLNGSMNGPGRSNAPPPGLGVFFIVLGGAVVLFGWALAACIIAAGRYLGSHRGYMFCFVIACLECLSVPLGTLLGIFTIIVLVRPSVKELFEATRAGVAEPSPRTSDDY